MLKYAIMKKILPKETILESIVSFKRAGASAIISYFAKELAKELKT